MGFSKWESFLENHIEGFFNKKFSSALEPVEVEKQLERELQRRKKKTRRGAIVPNSYTVHMNAEDYHRLCAQRFLDGLYTLLEKQVIVNDCFMDGRLQVMLEKDDKLSLGVCIVDSCYAEAQNTVDTAEPHTIVLDRSAFKPPLNLPVEHKMASLKVVDGPDLDAYLEFGEKQVFIGRREKNEFILTDPNASRLHASILYERHRHMLQDAQSLNGTLLNGKRIESVCLCAGDEIRIGNTVLLYEVI